MSVVSSVEQPTLILATSPKFYILYARVELRNTVEVLYSHLQPIITSKPSVVIYTHTNAEVGMIRMIELYNNLQVKF